MTENEEPLTNNERKMYERLLASEREIARQRERAARGWATSGGCIVPLFVLVLVGGVVWALL